ncbi:hypothetical protein NIES22_32080 [Calothrix brevissima NIES-22]|nr:hypothetical protein NIES22_32080 [Calothrix brevissima NIES-22]
MTTEIQQISESRKKLASAYRAVYAVGVLCIFFSILFFLVGNQLPDYLILVIGFLFFGLLYLFLGYFVQRKSKIALGIAVGLMSLNVLTGIFNMIQTGKPFGLILPMIFLSQTIQGFKAIELLKSKTSVEEGRSTKAEGRRFRSDGDSTPPEREPLNGGSVGVLNPCSLRSRTEDRSQNSLLPSASCPLPFPDKV